MEEARRLTAEAQGGDAPPPQWQGVDLDDPEEMEALLADTVLKEFKIRLGRIGIEYQTPDAR